ncbi:hypothetical protein CEXT_374731 [Caerostris extrusa]|uniref:Uncharacterized protein n=1 Tax=Caerostris extrusa TaxID=172846 RepID=A0AAV4X9V1_CAEEX|nr:hypothetical protein CEXT_374731 [Caerostris extrusa]
MFESSIESIKGQKSRRDTTKTRWTYYEVKNYLEAVRKRKLAPLAVFSRHCSLLIVPLVSINDALVSHQYFHLFLEKPETDLKELKK